MDTGAPGPWAALLLHFTVVPQRVESGGESLFRCQIFTGSVVAIVIF